jgi:hypothetical protein
MGKKKEESESESVTVSADIGNGALYIYTFRLLSVNADESAKHDFGLEQKLVVDHQKDELREPPNPQMD